jgi:2-dehydro-3-deoxy-D-gluconate 5-dehydrogenase
MKALQSLLDLQGKSAIVTGGAKGIGYGIAYRLAEAGARVVIADTDEVGAKQAAETLIAGGFTALACTTDVADEAAVEAMIATCRDAYGRVDILVNNAGIYPPMPLASMSAEDFERVMHVNLRSVFLTTKYVSEPMRSQGGGTIINITSIDALHPSMIGLAHYDASKHGLWGFTKNSALELAADNIRVNAIAPGGVSTPGVAAMNSGPSTPESQAAAKAFIERIPMRRMGEPDDIGTVALFLASDMSAYMTGSQIVVDGGVLLR